MSRETNTLSPQSSTESPNPAAATETATTEKAPTTDMPTVSAMSDIPAAQLPTAGFPASEMPTAFDPHPVESRWYPEWKESGFFTPEAGQETHGAADNPR